MTESVNIRKEIAIGTLRSILNAIPYVGSVLVEFFFETPNRIENQRKERHLLGVIKKLENISEDSIDLDFVKSEDFSDILNIIFKKIILRQASEKAEFFKNLTVASMLKIRSQQSIDWQIRYIEIIAHLNESEMFLLNALNKHPCPSGGSVKGVSTPFGIERKEFELCFDSLISKGLVFDSSLSGMPQHIGSGVGHSPSPRERIDISPLAKATIQFIPEVESIVKKGFEDQWIKKRVNLNKRH